MTDFFDRGLHYLGAHRKSTGVFVMNIGSMDGIMFDEMYGYTTMYDFKGIYVEPIPYLFEKLKQNISNHNENMFENSAISDYDGEIEMLMIDQNVIDNGTVHTCFYGMSAVYPPKNGLGSEGDKETIDKYGVLIKVPCITFETLIKKHNISKIDVIKIDAEGHDFKIFKQIDFDKYRPGLIRFEWINLSDDDKSKAIEILNKNDYIYEITSQDMTAMSKELEAEITLHENPLIYSNSPLEKQTSEIIDESDEPESVTLVTGLWDIGRSELENGWSRKYQDYLDNFEKLLVVDTNMIIFGDEELEKFVSKRRDPINTQFIVRNLEWFKNNDYYKKIQDIRTNPLWFNQVGWLKESTQSRLEMYNPIVMSKMFLLNDAQIVDKFESKYMFWIDAGITSTVHPGYFTHDNVLLKLPYHVQKFMFIAFPYETTTEIHGFEYNKICEFATDKVNRVARGGFFGGPKNLISRMNAIYYGLMMDTLSCEFMGTEESIFSIILYKYWNITNYVEILDDGLLGKFFEDLKNDNIIIKSTKGISDFKSKGKNNGINKNSEKSEALEPKVHLYVLSYNAPDQFESLIESFEFADENFLKQTVKFLLNNSTDETTNEEYDKLCSIYGFEQIKKNNIGICGGRQFIAEHFQASDADYYIFFEDDMLLNGYDSNGNCKSGFRKWVPNLYNRSLKIIQNEKYDFLKLNFTEFYGGNEIQWAWYNVPDDVRAKYFPTKIKKPTIGFDENPPLTQFTLIKKYEDIMYAEGDVYYCNWPLWFNRAGNKKVFLKPKYAHPFEQTWMSLVFQKQKQKRNPLKSAVLLLSPVNHDRVHHYAASERREN